MESDSKPLEDPMRHSFRKYMFFFLAQKGSLLGSTIVMFAIIWYLTDIAPPEKRNLVLSFASFLSLSPIVILSPIVGVIADHADKKKIIFYADFFQALSTLVLVLLFQFANSVQIWHIYVIIAIRGIGQAFHQTTEFALVPFMVPKEKLSRINGLNFLLSSFVQILGPVSAAYLLLILQTKWILLVDVITFLIALGPLIQLKIPVVNRSEEEQKLSFGKKFQEGFTTIRAIPGLLNIILFAVIANFLFQPLEVLLPNFIKFEHLGGKTELAIVMATMQIGMFIGAFITTLVKVWRKVIFVMTFCMIIQNLGYIALGLVPKGVFLWLYIAGVIFPLLNPIINTIFQSFMQMIVPKEKYARVMSVLISLSMLASPLGMILAGPLADLIGSIPSLNDYGRIRSLYVFAGIASLCTIFLLVTPKGLQFMRTGEKLQFDQPISEKTP